MACPTCVIKWLPQALQSGKMQWDKLHPRIKAILVRSGYDKKGAPVVTKLK